MKIFIMLTCISLTSAFQTSKFVAAGFVDAMHLSKEVSDPVTEDIYSAIECGLVCSNLPSKKCTRYRFCQQEVGKAGTCTMYESGEKCIMDTNSGSCSCFMLNYIMEKNGECTCAVGYYGNGDSCCKNVIIDCTEGEQLPHLTGRNRILSFIKPVGYPGDPYEVVCVFKFGGLTIILRRIDYKVLNFNRPWIDYVQGFENAKGSYWLGFSKIAPLLTNGRFRLHINLIYDGKQCTLQQEIVSMGTEENDFIINLNLKSVGQAEWCNYFADHRNISGLAFSTYDRDKTTSGCATMMQSGWWFDDNCTNIDPLAPYNNDTPPTITVSQGEPQLSIIGFSLLRINVV